MELPNFVILKLFSFVLWANFYIALRVKYPNKCPEWTSRVITLFHGTVAAFCGFKLCWWPHSIECFFTEIGPPHYLMMLWSWGYFAYDFMWCLLYWTTNISMLTHHVFTLIAIESYMNKKYSGAIYPCSVALLEITNPFLQVRWFLKEGGYNQNKLFTFVEVTYLMLFVILRAFVGTYVVLKALTCPRFAMDEKLIMFGLYAISVVFLYEIYGYVLYKYKTQITEFQGFLAEMGIMLDNK